MKLFSLLTLISLQFLMAVDSSKPNVIIILTDDQG